MVYLYLCSAKTDSSWNPESESWVDDSDDSDENLSDFYEKEDEDEDEDEYEYEEDKNEKEDEERDKESNNENEIQTEK